MAVEEGCQSVSMIMSLFFVPKILKIGSRVNELQNELQNE